MNVSGTAARANGSSSRGERNEALARAEVAVLFAMFACTTLGNSVLLTALFRRRKHASRMHVFMVHLCLADLVVAFFQVLPQLAWDITDVFLASDFACRFIKYMQIVGMFASTYMIVGMTVDRYQAVCFPMVTFKKRMAYWNAPVCAVWVVSLLLSVPQAVIFAKGEVYPGVYDCWGTFQPMWGVKAYITWMAMAIFVVPTAVLVWCQTKICRVIRLNIYFKTPHVHKDTLLLRRRRKQRRRQQKRQEDEEEVAALHRGQTHAVTMTRVSSVTGVSRAMVKTVKMTLVIVIVYVLCWSPFFVAQLWSVWDPNPPFEVGEVRGRPPGWARPAEGGFPTPEGRPDRLLQVRAARTHIHGVPCSTGRTLHVNAICRSSLLFSAGSSGALFTITLLLASLNSCTNPWIYMAFSGSTPRALLSCVLCRARRGGAGGIGGGGVGSDGGIGGGGGGTGGWVRSVPGATAHEDSMATSSVHLAGALRSQHEDDAEQTNEFISSRTISKDPSRF
ncbi:vasopressin V2 receptor-like isoform X1 [Lethenteron reissneri]|uniref:vasopressin V2 receptor-like isoform X1 n=1 Tax=Lethenteron reissneri TaxID=7753 RepID=UPI002AB603CD|nr:vasopressin V2 receptor-like isoform X1 [Lethenteron reissneri]